MIIIIVLKLDLGVNPEQGLCHLSEGSTRVDLDQYKDKSCYYHNFKTLLGGRLGQGPGYMLGGSTRVDSSQCMDKNDYYYSFKTRLKSWPDIRFESCVGKVNPTDPNFFRKNNQSNIVLTNFFFKKNQRVFYPYLSRVNFIFEWVRSSNHSFIFF